MISKIKKPVSILLSLVMVFSMFAIVPLSASAAVGDVLSEDDYLTFTAEEDNSSVTLKYQTGMNFKYNLNGAGWEDYTQGTEITLQNAGDYVRFSGTDTKFNSANHVSLTGKVACSGNVMSLRLDGGGKVQGLTNSCFVSMFSGCAGLTSAPELPETKLANYCYQNMFSGCENLTKAPELPATNLTTLCYYRMFYGCKSLTELPELPATNLGMQCYSYMFYGCESLTELPALPATTLATYCYSYMFNGCSNICISDEAGTFNGITYSAEYRIPSVGDGTSAVDALKDMFSGTKGKFKGTPDINTTYYVPAPAPQTFKVYAKKLTGETYTIENLTGETTVAQLKEIIADQIDIPVTAQQMLVFAGKQIEDAKTLAEYNIVNESTIFLVIRSYTVTWLNYDNSELGTTTVQYGATPSYDGETPTKPEDANNTYTFSGWTPAVAPVTGDVTYTAQFDATPKPHEHDGITFEKWTSADSLPTEAGNYVLTSDVTLSGTWTVPAGETNLCLAGYTIRQSGSGSVILLNNANEKLTVYDDGTTGTITGGNTTGDGGGVNITAGTFTLKGGNIEGNVASNGGGVSVSGQSSYFTMAGGTIRYNAGYTYTGGVLQMSSGKFTMTGGTIQNNVGKVYGGVGIADAQPSMSGNAVVKDNVFFNNISASNTKITKTESGYTIASGGTPSDVRHATANGLKINVIGAFESGAQIGIFNNSQTAAFTNGYKTHNPNDDPKDYFFSNDGNRFIMRDANKEAQLGGRFTITWKAEDGTVLETDENVVTGTTPEFNGTIPEKPEDDEATYTALWTPDIVPVTGDATYTVYYRPTTKRLYKVYIQGVEYGQLNMTVDKTSLWSTFNGSPIYNGTGYSLHHIQITSGADVMTVSGNMITVKKPGTAQFRGFVNSNQYLNFKLTATPYYTVTWKNEDGTELQTGLVLGGTTPVYNGAEPEKETADGNSYYPFLGWSPEVEAAAADTTYTAVFSDTAVPYRHTHDGIKFKEWTKTDSLPKYASNYCLTSDVTTSATWTVPAGEMNLCLNGHKIDANGGNYAVITIGNGRTLNLYDPEGGGVITGANHTAEAGGVMVSNGGHFNMYGGSIEGNRSNNGGGVSANGSNAVFHMYGGSIQYNEGYDNTGGILLQGNTTFTMSGGSIQHNAGKNFGGIGTYQATMIFDGDVNISDNYIYSGGTSGKIAKSGDTYTLDTTGGAPANVKTAHANDRIKVTGQLTLTHKIGIIRQGTKGVFTTGYTTSGNTADPSEYFYSDDANYTVGLSNGEAAIVDQYTVTWNNWNGDELEKDTRVAAGATPSYDGAEPTKEADNDYAYTFSGWTSSGGTFYAKGTALPAVSGNETYTATFTAVPQKLIAGHTLSLDGNIAINFYLDPAAAGMTANQVTANNLSYSFAWEDGNALKPVADQSGNAFTVSEDGNYIIVTCHVCAAEMTCGVNASFTLGDKTESEVYSVRKYGDSVLKPTAEWLAKYKTKYPDNTAKSYNNLVALVKKMLDYGAKAQTVFGIKTGDLANTGVDYTMPTATPDFDAAIEAANGNTADDLASSDFFGENFKAPSLVFLDYSTLKLYFENKDGSLSTSGLTPWNNYFYIKHENIAAAQLDTLWEFTVSGKTFRYSALDYAKVLATSANTDNANLAKALYWYNQAANAYFG